MKWEKMTIDEFAMYQRADGMNVVKTNGIWWAEIRPFFFRPLFPFAAFKPAFNTYPLKAMVGGVLHAVPSKAAANANMNFFVYDDLNGYSLDTLSKKRRRITEQGMENFVIKELTDPEEFVAKGHDVYLTFYNRTRYAYKRDRVDVNVFRKWAKNLFAHPKILKMGAYHRSRLSAIEISYHVEDVIIGDTLFSDDVGMKLKATDGILHKMRETAAKTKAKYIFLGLPSGVRSLDQSKLIRGCKVQTMPAYFKVNPVAVSIAKVFLKSSYQKLLDITAPNLTEVL